MVRTPPPSCFPLLLLPLIYFFKFSLLSGFWTYLFTKPKLSILVIGLDYSGKTTLLEKIKNKFGRLPSIPPEKIPPTIGMNLAKIDYQGYQVIIWDLGGQIKMRNIWENYYQDANAIIFVVDSSDISRLEEGKLTYEAVCDHDTVSNIPIYIFANKQDLVVINLFIPSSSSLFIDSLPSCSLFFSSCLVSLGCIVSRGFSD